MGDNNQTNDNVQKCCCGGSDSHQHGHPHDHPDPHSGDINALIHNVHAFAKAAGETDKEFADTIQQNKQKAEDAETKAQSALDLAQQAKDVADMVGITVSKEDDVITITATDQNGTNTVQLKDGKDGEKGADGAPGEKGETGETGETGPAPAHQWDGTSLQFQNPDGSWGDAVDLKGPAGGPAGPAGKDGKSAYEIACEELGYDGSQYDWARDITNIIAIAEPVYDYDKLAAQAYTGDAQSGLTGVADASGLLFFAVEATDPEQDCVLCVQVDGQIVTLEKAAWKDGKAVCAAPISVGQTFVCTVSPSDAAVLPENPVVIAPFKPNNITGVVSNIPKPNGIPVADEEGKLNVGWLPATIPAGIEAGIVAAGAAALKADNAQAAADAAQASADAAQRSADAAQASANAAQNSANNANNAASTAQSTANNAVNIANNATSIANQKITAAQGATACMPSGRRINLNLHGVSVVAPADGYFVFTGYGGYFECNEMRAYLNRSGLGQDAVFLPATKNSVCYHSSSGDPEYSYVGWFVYVNYAS